MGMMLRRYHDTAEAVSDVLDRPSKSGSKADWAAYAVQEGHDVEGFKRDDIVALFPEEAPVAPDVTPEPTPEPTEGEPAPTEPTE